MAFFEKYTGPVLFTGMCLIGGATALLTEWQDPDRAPFVDGPSQVAIEGRFEDALVINDPSIWMWSSFDYALFGEASAGAIVGRDGWLFTDEEFVIEDAFDTKLDDAIAEILSTAEQISARGARLSLILIPDKARIMSDMNVLDRAPQADARYEKLIGAVQSAGIDVVDQRPILIAANATAPTYLKTDTHWTPTGARAVARSIADQIGDWPLTRTDFSVTELETVSHDGDLAGFVKTGPLRSILGPEFVPLQQFSTELASADLGGLGLFGDVTVPGVLIGTSYSANARWHFEGFLKAETGIDMINMADEGRGPFAPMRDFLDSDYLETSSPEIVFWEIPERYTTLSEFLYTGDPNEDEI